MLHSIHPKALNPIRSKAGKILADLGLDIRRGMLKVSKAGKVAMADPPGIILVV